MCYALAFVLVCHVYDMWYQVCAGNSVIVCMWCVTYRCVMCVVYHVYAMDGVYVSPRSSRCCYGWSCSGWVLSLG